MNDQQEAVNAREHKEAVRLQKQDEEVVVPHWPRKSVTAERIGNRDDEPVPGCDAVWINLRTRGLGSNRQLSHVGIYVWFSASRKFHIEVKAHDIHSASQRELEEILRLVKALGKRVPAQMRDGAEETWEPLPMYLPRLMAALGVKHCVQYGVEPGADKIAPIYLYLEDLNKDIQRRITRFSRTATI